MKFASVKKKYEAVPFVYSHSRGLCSPARTSANLTKQPPSTLVMFFPDTGTDYATILLRYHAQIEITQTIHNSMSAALPRMQDPSAFREALQNTQLLLSAALEEMQRLIYVLEERFLMELSMPGKIGTDLKEFNLVETDINTLGNAVAQLRLKGAELRKMQSVPSERKDMHSNE